jgi:hypothetical protein
MLTWWVRYLEYSLYTRANKWSRYALHALHLHVSH